MTLFYLLGPEMQLVGLSFSVLWVITKLTFLRGGEASLNQFELAFLLLATKCALTNRDKQHQRARHVCDMRDRHICFIPPQAL